MQGYYGTNVPLGVASPYASATAPRLVVEGNRAGRRIAWAHVVGWLLLAATCWIIFGACAVGVFGGWSWSWFYMVGLWPNGIIGVLLALVAPLYTQRKRDAVFDLENDQIIIATRAAPLWGWLQCAHCRVVRALHEFAGSEMRPITTDTYGVWLVFVDGSEVELSRGISLAEGQRLVELVRAWTSTSGGASEVAARALAGTRSGPDSATGFIVHVPRLHVEGSSSRHNRAWAAFWILTLMGWIAWIVFGILVGTVFQSWPESAWGSLLYVWLPGSIFILAGVVVPAFYGRISHVTIDVPANTVTLERQSFPVPFWWRRDHRVSIQEMPFSSFARVALESAQNDDPHSSRVAFVFRDGHAIVLDGGMPTMLAQQIYARVRAWHECQLGHTGPTVAMPMPSAPPALVPYAIPPPPMTGPSPKDSTPLLTAPGMLAPPPYVAGAGPVADAALGR